MEIAFDARAFAVTRLRNNQPLPTAMTAISILAMAMVIYLFGGYLDSPDEIKPSFTQQESQKEKMIMDPVHGGIAAWDFSRWFAVLSPFIGVLLGLLGAFVVLH